MPDLDAALARSAPPVARARPPSSRTTSVSATPRSPRRRPHRRQPQLQAGDPAPRRRRSRRCRSASAPAVHGEWSLTTQSITPSASPCHSRSWFAASRIGGQHLNCVAPSGISSARQREVVRAGLRGDRARPSRRAAAIIGSASAEDRCSTCTRASGAPGQRRSRVAIAGVLRRRAGGRRGSRRSARPCAAGACSISVGSSACTIISASMPCSTRSAVGQLRRASRRPNSSTPECSRKHLKPNTPASCSAAQLAEVARHRAAPEPDVHVHPAARGRRA